MPGRLDTVPSAHSRSLASVRFLPQTRTPLRVGAKCGRPHRGPNRALTTGTSVWFQRFRPLGHGGDISMYIYVVCISIYITYLCRFYIYIRVFTEQHFQVSSSANFLIVHKSLGYRELHNVFQMLGTQHRLLQFSEDISFQDILLGSLPNDVVDQISSFDASWGHDGLRQ